LHTPVRGARVMDGTAIDDRMLHRHIASVDRFR